VLLFWQLTLGKGERRDKMVDSASQPLLTRKGKGMSKFDELCTASNKAVVDSCLWEDSCKLFGSKLVQGLMIYLECPQERACHVLLVDSQKEKNADIAGQLLMDQYPNRPIMMEDATDFDQEGWFHTGMAMNLRLGAPGVVGYVIMFNLHYKKMPDGFLVTFARDIKEFKIGSDPARELFAAYEHFFKIVKTHFESVGEHLLSNRGKRKFGFV
jgi:hypothetical protein